MTAPTVRRRDAEKHRTYVKRWHVDRARGIDRSRLDVDRVREHLAGFAAEGWTAAGIGRAAGTSSTGVRDLLSGRTGSIQRAKAVRLLAVTRADLYRAATDEDRVPVTGFVRRVQALQALGWTHRELIARGVDPALGPAARYIDAARWRRAATVYDALWDQPGPSRQTRAAAPRKGWAPPLAWDEDSIDDPQARPVGTVGAQQSTRDALVEDVTELAADGGTVASVCARLGKDRRNLERTLQRAGRHDLWARLRQNATGVLGDDEGVSA